MWPGHLSWHFISSMFYFFLFETDLRPLISKDFFGGGWHDDKGSEGGMNMIHQTNMGQKSKMYKKLQ